MKPLIGLIALPYTLNQVQQNSWDKVNMKTKTLEFILLSVVPSLSSIGSRYYHETNLREQNDLPLREIRQVFFFKLFISKQQHPRQLGNLDSGCLTYFTTDLERLHMTSKEPFWCWKK